MFWRYIPPFSAPGSIQMAVDTWLFHQCRQGLGPPTLRFYSWEPVTVSLGYFQRRWPDHWSSLTWQGRPLKLVRRPSGGRAVLHHGDLTYCIVNTLEGVSRKEAYTDLCQFLIAGWAKLGRSLQFGTAGRGYHHQTNCFRLATGADLIDAEGNKFIGSAQLWRNHTVLQHGSIALNPDPALEAIIFPVDQQNKTLPSTPGLPYSTVIQTLHQTAQETFQVECQLKPLSLKEWQGILAYLPTPPSKHETSRST